MAKETKLKTGMRLVGKSLKTYTVDEPVSRSQVAKGIGPHIWTAHTKGGTTVLLKKSAVNNPVALLQMRKEIEIQKIFQGSQYIRPILDTIHKPTDVTGMILEYLPATLWDTFQEGGSLARHPTTIKVRALRRIMKRVLQGLDEMHEKGWAHLSIHRSWSVFPN